MRITFFLCGVLEAFNQNKGNWGHSPRIFQPQNFLAKYYKSIICKGSTFSKWRNFITHEFLVGGKIFCQILHHTTNTTVKCS